MAEQKLPRLSKRMKVVRGKIDRSKAYAVDEALKLIKETAVAKFDESVDIAVNLGIDAKKSDQTVRGSVVLPAGIGKNVRVAVFTQGDKAKAATDAGADRRLRRPRCEDRHEGSDGLRRDRHAGCDEGRRATRPDPRSPRPMLNPSRDGFADVVTAVKNAKADRSSTGPTRRASFSARSGARRLRPISSRPT
jgi:hypothetical protein